MKPITLPGIEEYVEKHTSPDPQELVSLAQDAHRSLDAPQMMAGSVVARLLQVLILSIRPRQVLEIGTFAGYSTLSMAAVLAPGSKITTCEISEKHADFAQKYFDASPHRDKIRLELGPALVTLAKLSGPFDFAFIDADKGNSVKYLEAVLEKLSPGGLIAVDNTLWNGDVMQASSRDEDTRALRQFNDRVVDDPGLSSVLLSVRDGVTLIRRNGAL